MSAERGYRRGISIHIYFSMLLGIVCISNWGVSTLTGYIALAYSFEPPLAVMDTASRNVLVIEIARKNKIREFRSHTNMSALFAISLLSFWRTGQNGEIFSLIVFESDTLELDVIFHVSECLSPLYECSPPRHSFHLPVYGCHPPFYGCYIS